MDDDHASFKTVAMLDLTIIRRFSTGLSGHLILPGDTAYEAARWSWNRAVNRHPGMIVRCSGSDDIVRAVDFARGNDLLVAVRGGGHSFAGHSTCDGGMVIDLSAMKEIKVDPARRIARTAAGVKVGEFDRATQALGLASVMGGCESVGVTGLTLGGGQGSLSGLYGLACDNLLSAEVVTADGRLVIASAAENPELFWATRGGAGNFAIATALDFRLHALGVIYGGAVAYPVKQTKEVLRAWRYYAHEQPDELTTVFGAAMIPAGPTIGILACYCGDLDKGAEVLRPLGSFGTVLASSLGPVSYLDFQHSIEELNPPSQISAHRRSNFAAELTDEGIDVIADFVQRPPRSFFVGLYPYRGAICRVGASETAFPIRRQGFDIWIDSYWLESSAADSSIEWVNGFWRAMRPFTTDAVYVNNLSDEGEERTRAAYGANYDRLVALKNKYDPTNFFRMNQNINPGKGTPGISA